jgi:hypothetical protein
MFYIASRLFVWIRPVFSTINLAIIYGFGRRYAQLRSLGIGLEDWMRMLLLAPGLFKGYGEKSPFAVSPPLS